MRIIFYEKRVKMSIRTDLAIEENLEEHGINSVEKKEGDVTVCEVEIKSEEKAKILRKNIGKYITISFPSLEKLNDFEIIKKYIKSSLESLLPKSVESTLIIGLGNTDITADSVGPVTAEKILATRHIVGEFSERIGLKGLKCVAVVRPDVLGKTGIETAEITESIVKKIKPQAVIVIDALCSGSIDRLFNTIQLSDSGISPGSGVKNKRKELSQKTLGVPVIAVGIPTVVDALTLAFELTGKESKMNTDLIVTPKDADLLTHRMSEILAESLNVFLQPEIEEEILLELV